MLRIVFVSVALLAVLALGCSKKEATPDPAIELEAFTPAGWSIEFDTVVAILDAGKKAHLTVFKEHTTPGSTGARMLSIVGPDGKGKLRRYGASETLLPSEDVSSASYIAPLNTILKVRKDVISVFVKMSAAPNESYHAQEEFKIRFDKASGRFHLIGYDLTDITDGITTVDSRNYPTGNRVIDQRKGKDTLCHRLLKIRHSGPFLEDINPWDLAVDPSILTIPHKQIPETKLESAAVDELRQIPEQKDTADTDDKVQAI